MRLFPFVACVIYFSCLASINGSPIEFSSGRSSLNDLIADFKAKDMSHMRNDTAGGNQAADDGNTVFKLTTESRRSLIEISEKSKDEVATNIKLEEFPEKKPSSLIFGAPTSSEFVGLINQGSTCYLNSVLQSMFHLEEFRKIIFSVPCSKDSSFPYALQSLMREMQNPSLNTMKGYAGQNCDYLVHSNKKESFTKSFPSFMRQVNQQTSKKILGPKLSLSTLSLTKSLAINPNEQQDIGEFTKALFEKLIEFLRKERHFEHLMKIDKLFACHDRTTITPIDNLVADGEEPVFFKTSIKNSVNYEIRLQVSGMGSIMNSIDALFKDELMVGENQYYSDEIKGYCDATKSYRFTELPPILNFHLHRYLFDNSTNRLAKIFERFEFGPVLNMTRYSDKNIEMNYNLHSVLVHVGRSAGFGHYVSYVQVRPNEWFKFDDENVSRVTAEEAIENNFGDLRSSHTAYALIYKRRNHN